MVRARVVKFGRVIDDLKRDARPCHDPVSVEGGHIEPELMQRRARVRQDLVRLRRRELAAIGPRLSVPA